MEKILKLTAIALFFFSNEVMAQTELVATLSHEGDVKAYYGDSAFVKAYKDASDGDCITLSSGRFEGISVAKAITVRGAGMNTDDEAQTTATTLILGWTNGISISAKKDKGATFEDLYLDTYNGSNKTLIAGNDKGLIFLRCRLNGFKLKGGIVHFVNCAIMGTIEARPESDADAFYISNSIVESFDNQFNSGIRATNCILYNVSGVDSNYPELRNCIFIRSGAAPSNTFNCVALGDGFNSGDKKSYEDIFGHISNNTNQVALSKDVFSNYTSGVNFTIDETQYVLTNEAKAKFTGNDGTEVGIYGGANPFSAIPSTPRIIKMNIGEISEEGRMKVNIEIK